MAGMRARTGVRSFWFGFVVLLVVGGAFSLVGASLLSSNLKVVRGGTYTRATVVDVVKHTSSRSTTYAAVIEYATPTGERIRGESPTGSNSQAYRAGDTVGVLYLQSDPHTFLLDKFSDKYGFPAIFLLAGVLCLLIDVVQVARRILRSSRSSTSTEGPYANRGT